MLRTSIIFTGLSSLMGGTAAAIPQPHTYPLVVADNVQSTVDPALQDWIDEHAGVPTPESLSQAQFDQLIAKSDPAVAMYLKLVRNARMVTSADVKDFLTRVAAREKMPVGELLVHSVYYELLKTDLLSADERADLIGRLAQSGTSSCVQKLKMLDDINATNLTQLTDDGVRNLLSRVNEFRSQNFRRRALRQVMDSLPVDRRDGLREALVSHLSQHMSVLRSYDWMNEYYQQTERPHSDQTHVRLDEIRSLSGKKQCSKARTSFFELLAANPSEKVLPEIINVGKAIDTCYRGRDAGMRLKFWEEATVALEKTFKFSGWAEGNLRSGYLHWARNDFNDARRIFSTIITKSEQQPEYRAKALYALARVNENDNDYDGAAKSFSEYVSNFPHAENFNEALESLVLIHTDRGDWDNAIRYLENLIKMQDLLDYDDRSTGSHSFALFWAGRVYLELGRSKEATEMFRRVASEYYSTFYGAVGHFLLEKLIDKKLALQPQRTPLFSFKGLMDEFSPQDQERLKRVSLMLRLGLRSDALCELDEIDTEAGKPERMLTRSLILHAAGNWLDAIKVFDSLPRSFRNTLSIGFERILFPQRYADVVRDNAARAGVDPDLVLAIIRQESVFNPMARSPVGAQGLMQLMPATAKVEAGRLSSDYVSKAVRDSLKKKVNDRRNLLEPETNLMLGIHHVKTLLNKYGNPVYLLSAYNASPSAAERWMGRIPNHDILSFIERIPYKETRAYVKLVLRNYFYYKRWYGLNTDSLVHIETVALPKAALAKLEKKPEITPTSLPNH